MTTLDTALRDRAIRPTRYIDYTSISRRRKSTYLSNSSLQTHRTKIVAEQERGIHPESFRKRVPESRYYSVALHAVKYADSSYSELNIEDLPIYIEQPNSSKWTSRLIYSFGILVLFISLIASIHTFIVNRNAQEQVQALGEQTYSTDVNGVQEGTGSDPAESSVPENALLSYVPQNPQDPRYIRIPSLGVISRVKSLGIDASSGAIDAPRNIHDAGWYNGSVRPGSGPGTSLLLGHVSGWTAPGVFKKIDTLNENDKIIIENGEGRTYTYHVYKIETKNVEDIDMNKVLATEKAGEHIVKLMTCSGDFNNQTEEYDSRTIVYAKQIL